MVVPGVSTGVGCVGLRVSVVDFPLPLLLPLDVDVPLSFVDGAVSLSFVVGEVDGGGVAVGVDCVVGGGELLVVGVGCADGVGAGSATGVGVAAVAVVGSSVVQAWT